MSTSKTDYLRSDPTQNRQRLLDVLESIQDDVLSLDRDWNFAYINTFAAKEWGYKPSELLHRNIWEVLPRFVGTAFEANIREAMEKQQVIRFEWKALYASGYREVTFFPSKEGVTMYAKNITERKKAEQAIAESREHYLKLFNNIDEGFAIYEMIYDKDGKAVDYRFLEVNPAYQSQTGLKAEDIVGKSLLEVFPDVEKSWVQTYADIVKTGKPKRFENYNHNTGRLYSIYGFSMGGNRIATIFEDITEQKRATEELEEREELYRTVFDNSEDGFQLVKPIFDQAGNPVDYLFLNVNKAYERQVGLKAEQVVGKTVREIVPNIEPEWIETHGQVAKTGRSLHREIYNDFSKRWYDLYYFKYKQGQVGVLFRDITSRKNLEQQLHDKERLAAIGATAGMVGHDIRNPLQAMVSDVYLMKEAVTSNCVCGHKEELIESLDGIDQNIAYINKIVQDLQDYARPLNPEYSTVAVSTVLVKVFENVRVPDSIKLSIKVKDLENTKTDPMLLQRALANLVTNAIQAMPNGGFLEISAHPEKDKAVITVSDTGVGIPDDVKPKLFAPMVTTKSKGQGFGLAVSKRIIEALKGTISFESERGKGTKFTVELPTS